MNDQWDIPLNLRKLVDAAGAAIDSIKLNDLSSRRQGDRRLRVKRRRKGSEYIAGLANLFLPLANARVSVREDPKDWQRWETGCYQLVNGDQFHAFAKGQRTVCQEELPGSDLRKLQDRGALNAQVLKAAAREIRRVHRLRCPDLGRPWSHGDLNLGNVIYDDKTDRARLIDFEVIHDKSLSVVARHADDLLAFLQDMVGRVSARQWKPFALCFIDAYGHRPVIARLRKLLVVPNAVPGLWWGIRSSFYDRAPLEHRINALRHALETRAQGESGGALRRKLARHRSHVRAIRSQ